MPFLELSTVAPAHAPDAIENCFFGAGALTVTLADAADHPILEPLPGTTPLWPTVRVTGLFDSTSEPDALIRAIHAGLLDDSVVIETRWVHDRVWEREWLKDFKPMRFGQNLWVCPGGQPPPETTQTQRIVWLDPGLAFGTGTHASTALCLTYLDRHPPMRCKVLDVGCGSGILTLASLKCGARWVHALDIDPQALIATEENAKHNGVWAQVHLTDATAPWDCDHELILANILAEPLIELAPRIATACAPNGQVVLAGLLDAQIDAVAAAYRPFFALAPAEVQAGWALLHGRRLSV
jgi:ribosomal protein L11 methyltransferase